MVKLKPRYQTSLSERLEIYQKALDIIVRGEMKYGLGPDFGLCLLLPCIWCNVGNFLERRFDNNHEQITFSSTPDYFPEFGEYYKLNSYKYTNEYRIKILTEIITNIRFVLAQPKH